MTGAPETTLTQSDLEDACRYLPPASASHVPEGVSSVGQLSSDAVIQAVGFMVAGISGSRPPPEALSTRGSHPAERFHACRLVASRVRVSGPAASVRAAGRLGDELGSSMYVCRGWLLF